jgi:S1-C subfamily serine protease
MKRYWSLFSQVVTVLLAAYFVVATLKPQWLHRQPTVASIVPVFESGNTERDAAVTSSSYSAAAKVAAPAVVSINTSKAPAADAQQTDPWFRVGQPRIHEQVP